MPLIDWLQLGIYIAAIVVITKYLGAYLVRVLDPDGKTFLDKLMKPLERLTYRLFGIDPHKEQNWKQYTVAMLLFSAVSLFFTYIILRIQQWLPLNPQGLPNLSPHLAFNTAVSFTTNTNWQSYAGEATMSYLSQMVALVIHNFVSAATGIALAAALVRGIARHTATTIGNFWTDLTRTTYYLLLPIAFVFAVVLIAQGIPQNFHPYTTANVVQPTSAASTQSIPQGPIASQEAIKMIGTNGGGYLNANSATPYENPNGLSNFLEMLGIIGISSALTYYYGRMVKNQKHGWAIWAAMLAVFLVGFFVAYHYEQAGNPIHQQLGVAAQDGNMEGKEVRFGIFNSSLFATLTTDASNGGVNSMHDSFTPLGGMIPMWLMQLGEVIYGGVGSGLYGMIMFAIVAVFVSGLMIGRTPEYLGKKIEAYEMKMAAIAILIPPLVVLVGTAVAVLVDAGKSSVANPGAHGFSEILYAFSSAGNNNGSAFAGLSANTPFYNTALGLVMLFSRYWLAVPVLAIAGSLAAKKIVPFGAGSLPTHTPLFVALLIGTVLIVGALAFFPVLALGPVVEQLQMMGVR